MNEAANSPENRTQTRALVNKMVSDKASADEIAALVDKMLDAGVRIYSDIAVKKLLGARVLILPDDKPDETPSGLVIPDNIKSLDEQVSTGLVIKTGPGTWSDERWAVTGQGWRPPQVSRGQRVLFSNRAGIPVDIMSIRHRLLMEGDIFGVIE